MVGHVVELGFAQFRLSLASALPGLDDLTRKEMVRGIAITRETLASNIRETCRHEVE